MKNKVVIFIDEVGAKNKLQIALLQQFGFEPLCFVTHFRPESDVFFAKGKQVALLKSFFKRWGQLFYFFRKNHKSIHHIELYPGGRFTFIYVLLGKLFSLKTLCIERGDLLYYNKNGYPLFTRFSMWVCYRFSTMLWYRELYMKPLLEKIRKRGLYFLHNAIEPVHHTPGPAIKKDIDFLWLNRVIPERKYKWFLDIIQKVHFSHTHNFLVGIRQETIFSPDQDYVKNNKPANLVLEPYSNDPGSFFKRARFFVLPADVVFANHALLEAMAYGVVPLVSRQQGSDLIVDDHVNGFIFQHTIEAMEMALQEALQLTSQQYDAYSLNAARKIQDSFSVKKYSDSLSNLYKMLE